MVQKAPKPGFNFISFDLYNNLVVFSECYYLLHLLGFMLCFVCMCLVALVVCLVVSTSTVDCLDKPSPKRSVMH